ncbi:HAT [Theobroma cacao]|nr:HAT [Theobroma cacao]
MCSDDVTISAMAKKMFDKFEKYLKDIHIVLAVAIILDPRDFLTIPVSTVASESVFSIGGRVVSDHRSRLKPYTLEALMCTQNWLRNETKGSCITIEDSIVTLVDTDTEKND